jgi:hypothetical protein
MASAAPGSPAATLALSRTAQFARDLLCPAVPRAELPTRLQAHFSYRCSKWVGGAVGGNGVWWGGLATLGGLLAGAATHCRKLGAKAEVAHGAHRGRGPAQPVAGSLLPVGALLAVGVAERGASRGVLKGAAARIFAFVAPVSALRSAFW